MTERKRYAEKNEAMIDLVRARMGEPTTNAPFPTFGHNPKWIMGVNGGVKLSICECEITVSVYHEGLLPDNWLIIRAADASRRPDNQPLNWLTGVACLAAEVLRDGYTLGPSKTQTP